MSEEIEVKIEKIPVLRNIAHILKRKRLKFLNNNSVYDLLELFGVGIYESGLTYHASAIAFSFFMSLFPFALFILNLIPFIPIAGFQSDFLHFVEASVPPNTFDAIEHIINDILHNSHSGLLSTGFILSIFLMSNGISGVLGGFESQDHVKVKRGFFRQYLAALGLSLLLSFLLLVTIATIVIFEILIRKFLPSDVLNEYISLIIIGRYIFAIIMILLTISILYKYGTKRDRERSLITVGSIFTTVLIIIDSYIFGIWVVKFSRYNELYGSIGTLLILMFYIWINCLILLLGFELNAMINELKNRTPSTSF